MTKITRVLFQEIINPGYRVTDPSSAVSGAMAIIPNGEKVDIKGESRSNDMEPPVPKSLLQKPPEKS